MSTEITVKSARMFDKNICGCQTYEVVTKGKGTEFLHRLCNYHDDSWVKSIDDMETNTDEYKGIDGCDFADEE
tara:strand:- start:3463 stop:3681 length:219 start_codon:yes stop_codon:yes gene_type:complete